MLDGVHVAQLGYHAERLIQGQDKTEYIQLLLNQSSKSGLNNTTMFRILLFR